MEPPSRLRVSIVNNSGKPIPAALIRAGVKISLQRSKVTQGRVCVYVTHDDEQRRLNRTFRLVDKSTDVLTFASNFDFCKEKERQIGDISISIDHASAQAKERGVTVNQELCSLAIHGALHLAGFDDETQDDLHKMQNEMGQVSALIGLPPESEWTSLDLSENEKAAI